MSKKSLDQKPEVASVLIFTKRDRNARPGKAAVIGAGEKKAISQSNSDRVLSLLKQASGATLDELMKATKWQAHSVRGFLSGVVRKRRRLTVLSECDGAGTRRYRIDDGREV